MNRLRAIVKTNQIESKCLSLKSAILNGFAGRVNPIGSLFRRKGGKAARFVVIGISFLKIRSAGRKATDP